MDCGLCLPLNGVWGGTDGRRTLQGSAYAGISCHSLPSVAESTQDRNFSCQVQERGSLLPDQDGDRFDREHLRRELEALGRQVVGDTSTDRSDLPL